MAARSPASSPRGSSPSASPRRAAWCRPCGTTAPLSHRRWFAYPLRRSRYLFRQMPERAGDDGNPLDRSRTRLRDLALLEGDDREPGKGFEQFAGPQQEIGVAGTAEPLVADHEGLVEDNPAARERRAERREQWAVQVIGHDDSVIVSAQRPWVAAFQIEVAYGAALSRQR